MPHLIIEHSEGLAAHIDIEALTDELHAEAMGIEALPVGGLRTRVYVPTNSKVGDGRAEAEFLYLTLRIGQGRSEVVKREIGERLFRVITDMMARLFEAHHPISLGLEIQDIEKEWTWKQNNIHQILKDDAHD